MLARLSYFGTNSNTNSWNDTFYEHIFIRVNALLVKTLDFFPNPHWALIKSLWWAYLQNALSSICYTNSFYAHIPFQWILSRRFLFERLSIKRIETNRECVNRMNYITIAFFSSPFSVVSRLFVWKEIDFLLL